MSLRTFWLAISLIAALAMPSLDAAAKSRSSRGYSAPPVTRQAPSAPAAPSVSPPSVPSAGSAPSAPSSSVPRSANGYGLPGQAPAAAAAPSSGLGGSDAALSKQASGASLRSYDTSKERARFQAPSVPVVAPSAGFSGYAGRFHSFNDYYAQRNGYYSGFGWQPPGYVYASRPSFGMWDALFLWFMLNSIGNASHAMWFHDHADDPGYQQWRQEADRLAADNADLRTKLAELDTQQKALAGEPRDPNYMPPDAKPELALASENAVAVPSPSGGTHWLLDIVLVLIVGGGIFFLRRRVLA